VQAAAVAPAPHFGNVLVSHDSFLAHSEPAIAENPANHRNLVAGSKFFTDPSTYQFKIGTYYSRDGGHSWHASGLLPGFEAYSVTSDISVAFSKTGVAYVCVLAAGGNRSGIFVSHSDDGGKTWSNPATVFLDTTGATFSDKPWMAVDQTTTASAGAIYVAWNLDGGSDHDAGSPDAVTPRAQRLGSVKPGIVLARSTDGGKTFTPPTLVQDFGQGGAIGAIPAVGTQGQVYVAYVTFDASTGAVDHIEVVRSADHGQTFMYSLVHTVHGIPNHLGTSTFRSLSLPTFAVSSKDGSMVVAWADEGSRDADILASTSRDGGTTWSPSTRVNHDRLNNGKDQFQPALAVAPNGIYTCAWFDRRHDPNNRLIDEEIAQSSDGGITWGHNFRVTAKSWDPSIDAPLPEGKPSNTFIGDYQALAVDNTTVHPLWNDTQNGHAQEIETAVLPETRLR